MVVSYSGTQLQYTFTSQNRYSILYIMIVLHYKWQCGEGRQSPPADATETWEFWSGHKVCPFVASSGPLGAFVGVGFGGGGAGWRASTTLSVPRSSGLTGGFLLPWGGPGGLSSWSSSSHRCHLRVPTASSTGFHNAVDHYRTKVTFSVLFNFIGQLDHMLSALFRCSVMQIWGRSGHAIQHYTPNPFLGRL